MHSLSNNSLTNINYKKGAPTQPTRLVLARTLRRHNLGDTRNAILEDALDAIRKGHGSHGATIASTLQLDRDDTVLGHVNEADIATVSLQARTNQVQNRQDIALLYHGNSF
jgi:hypothetical protein